MSKIKVTQVRSIIDRSKKQKLTIEALGLGRPNY
ncbi:MAG: 50S ribosomal protein L30, partial [Ignavibacteriae bacterium]|nr:50S ribosomal protein L30 [Ignavibacteriota bacterium]